MAISWQEAEDLRVHGLLKFIVLKKMNRMGHMRCKLIREETNKVWSSALFNVQFFFMSHRVEKEDFRKNTLKKTCFERDDTAHLSTSWKMLQAKQEIDKHHLKLQNLLYEVMHLQKEINKCLQFKWVSNFVYFYVSHGVSLCILFIPRNKKMDVCKMDTFMSTFSDQKMKTLILFVWTSFTKRLQKKSANR